jgi:hypothetical protein
MGNILKFTAAAALSIGLGVAFVAVGSPAQAAGQTTVAKACKADAKKHCKGAAKMSEDEIRACLETHKDHVGAKCKKALEASAGGH